MKLWQYLKTILYSMSLCYNILYCHNTALAIDIYTDQSGDYTTTTSDSIYNLYANIVGNFNINTANTNVTIKSSGIILQALKINTTGSTHITVDTGGRIGNGIVETGTGAPVFLTVNGTVDGGIKLDKTGRKEVLISGALASVGLITGVAGTSIIGSTDTASTYTIQNGAILNGGIKLGTQNDTVTIDGATVSGSIIGDNGKKTINIRNGATVNGEIKNTQGSNTINVTHSTIAGGITTNLGLDVITLQSSTLTGNISVGENQDIINLLDASSVSGHIYNTGTTTVKLNATFGSSVLGQIYFAKTALLLSAPTGITVNEKVTSGANSVYNINRGEFQSDIELRGTTNLTASNSTFRANITAPVDGNINIQLNSSTAQGISSENIATTSNTRINLQNNSYVKEIKFGNGIHRLDTMNSRVSNITANSTTHPTQLNIVNSLIDGAISTASTLQANFTNSVVINDIQMPANNNTNTQNFSTINATNSYFKSISINGKGELNLRNSTVKGNITATQSSKSITATIDRSIVNDITTGREASTLTLQRSQAKDIHLQDTNNTVTISHSFLNNINLGNTQDTIAITGSTFHEIIASNARQGNHTLTLNNVNYLTGSKIDIGTTGRMNLNGDLYIAKDVSLSTTAPDIYIKGSSLTINNDARFILTPQPYTTKTYLEFNSLTNNNSTRPITISHVNIFKGFKNQLDLSKVTALNGSPYLVEFMSILGEGSPMTTIEDVIISSPNIRPVTRNKYVLLGGYLYSLEKNATNLNHYDLNYKGISPTNYGYAAAHNAIRSFNTTIWHSLISHFQEEALMFREKDGKQRKSGSIINAISVWTRGGYTASTIAPSFEAPRYTQESINFLAGADFANIKIGKTTSMMFQFFAGIGDLKSKFDKGQFDDITISAKHFAVNAGASVGFQKNTHQGRGKLYSITSIWYSMMNNTLDSNLFLESSKWDNHSLNITSSLGYSVYLQRLIITPQLDLGYFYTFKKRYHSLDGSIITLNTASKMVGRASLLLGYDTKIGFTPYLRGGIEVPLFKGKGNGAIFIENSAKDYTYETTTFTSDITAGIAYRGGFKHFSLTLSTEATVFLGEKSGIEAFAQVGFQF